MSLLQLIADTTTERVLSARSCRWQLLEILVTLKDDDMVVQVVSLPYKTTVLAPSLYTVKAKMARIAKSMMNGMCNATRLPRVKLDQGPTPVV